MRPAVDREALTVAMTLVPGLVSRNKSFSLFEDQEVRLARARAAQLRGIVVHLTGAHGRVESLHVVSETGAWQMSYRVPRVRMERRATLTDVEYACVAHLASRAGIAELRSTDEGRARIEAVLSRLSGELKAAV